MSIFSEPVSLNWAATAQPKQRILPLIGIGLGAFAAGGVLMAGFFIWKSQQEQVAEMTALLEAVRSGQGSIDATAAEPQSVANLMPVSPAAPAAIDGASLEPIAETVLPTNADNATRSVSSAILAVTGDAAGEARVAETAAAAETASGIILAASVGVMPEAQTASGAVAAKPARLSPADQIRLLTSRATDPTVANALAPDEARLAVMSQAIAGVRELASIAATGAYTIEVEDRPGGQVFPHLILTGFEDAQSAMQELLLSAASEDLISVPSHVVGPNGSLDGDTLMLAVIQRSLGNGSAAEREAAARLSAEIQALTQTDAPGETEAASGTTVYIVESGDSLAYIALQFYGDTNQYQRILDANSGTLNSPERIQVGQTLRIPNA